MSDKLTFSSFAIFISKSIIDYNVFEGFKISGLPRYTMSRGDVVWDSSTNSWKGNPPSLWDAYFLISKKVRTVNHDIRKGLITLTIDTNDPKLSMEIANSMVSAINDYIRKESIVETNETIDYLQVELSNTDIVDIKKAKTAVCCSVGWIVKEDSKSTIVMADYSFEDNGEIKQGGNYTTIPTKNILKIKKIKI